MNLFFSLQTVRTRLMLWNVAVLALVLLVLGSVLRLSVERNLTASVDRDLEGRARGHQDMWAHRPDGGPGGPGRPGFGPGGPGGPGRDGPGRGGSGFFVRGRPPEGFRVEPGRQTRVMERLFDLNGKAFFPPGEEASWDRAAFGRAANGQEGYSNTRIDNEPVRIFSAPLRRGREVQGVVQVGYSLADVQRALGNLNATLLTLIPVGLLAAGLGGLFLTRRMLCPLREVTQTAERIGAEDLAQRLTVSGKDEFSELAATFNGMLDRLERAFEQQRRFTADASHELRTPLTVIKATTSLALARGDLSGDQQKGMENVDRAAGLMNRIVQDLLLLARSDVGQMELLLRPIRLAEVLEVAVECVLPQGGAAICNRVQAPDLIVQGDTSHLTRLFVNLLENAVRHTPADGKITLSAHQEGPVVIVSVEDTGAGIPAEHLPHVCERFYRVDEARSRAHGGTGLGLAICTSIVRAHGGSLDITSEAGVGTAVRVILCSTVPGEA